MQAMKKRKNKCLSIYEVLTAHFETQRWWVGSIRYEIGLSNILSI